MIEGMMIILGRTVNVNEKTDLEYRIRIEVKERVLVSEESLTEIYSLCKEKNNKDLLLDIM